MTLDEVAALLRAHRSTLYRMLKKGELSGFKVGADWRFHRTTIDAWRFGQEKKSQGSG